MSLDSSGSPSWGHDPLPRGGLADIPASPVFTLPSITAANYNYEVAMKIILEMWSS